MVAIKHHRYFPHDNNSRSYTEIAEKKLAKINKDGKDAGKENGNKIDNKD